MQAGLTWRVCSGMGRLAIQVTISIHTLLQYKNSTSIHKHMDQSSSRILDNVQDPAHGTFLIKLSKKQAQYLAKFLPQRYSMMPVTIKKGRTSAIHRQNTPRRFSSQDNKSGETILLLHSEEGVSLPTDRKRTRGSVKKANSEKIDNSVKPTVDQGLLTTTITKFLQVARKIAETEPSLAPILDDIEKKVQAGAYNTFSQFQNEILSILTRQELGYTKELIAKIKEEINDLRLIYSQLQGDEPSKTKPVINKTRKQRSPKKRSIVCQNKSLNKEKVTVTKMKKELAKKSRAKSVVFSKSHPLNNSLFSIKEETESETNSEHKITTSEAVKINRLFKKLHRVDQERMLKSLKSDKKYSFISDMKRKDASVFLRQVQTTLTKNAIGFNSDTDSDSAHTESSFQIEDDR